MEKLTLEIKYDSPKTHQIGPEISQQSMHYWTMKSKDRTKTVPKHGLFQFKERPKSANKMD